jgi:hypothetical protein
MLAMIVVFMTTINTSCFSQADDDYYLGVAVSEIIRADENVPPGIGCDGTVLLCIVKGKKSYDKYMKKQVEKNYFGKYEFVLAENLKDEKYANTSVYRYIFAAHIDGKYNVDLLSPPGTLVQDRIGNATYSYSYSVLDRTDLRLYGNGVSSSFFSKLIKANAIRLEKSRSANCPD